MTAVVVKETAQPMYSSHLLQQGSLSILLLLLKSGQTLPCQCEVADGLSQEASEIFIDKRMAAGVFKDL